MKNIVLEVDVDKIPLSNCLRYKNNNNYIKINEYVVNSIVNAELLMKQVFPIKNNDIFISYSHRDYDEIKRIERYICYYYELKCFVDGEAWRYQNNIINDIEMKSNNYNSEELSKAIRDNVDIMLTTSLMNVMNNSKLILLFNTKNYRKYDKGNYFTNSPWIYHEQCFAKFIDINNQNAKPYIRHFATNESIELKYLLGYRFDSIKLTNLLLWLREIKLKKVDILSVESIDLLYNKYENANNFGGFNNGRI